MSKDGNASSVKKTITLDDIMTMRMEEHVRTNKDTTVTADEIKAMQMEYHIRETTKPTNPKDRAATTRLDLSLFPDTAVAYGALAMTEGDLKYGGYNYRPAGVLSSVYVAACRRHLAKWYNGEEVDPRTKVPHLANALACLAVLIDSLESGNLNDDRPPYVDVAGLINRFEGNVKHLQELFPNGPNRFRQKS